MKSNFEVMFEKINESSTKQVNEIIQILSAQKNPSKEQKFVLWVAECVLEERMAV